VAGRDAGGTAWLPPSALPLLKTAVAFLGFSALVTEVATLAAQDRFVAGNFFSYFTVESNALAEVSLVLSAFAYATGRTSRALDVFRGAVTLFMTTTILIFIVLLSGYDSADLTAVPWDNTVLHYLLPIAVVLDWLVDPPRSRTGARWALAWLAGPLAYLVYSLVRGHVVGWYPYPFMDPSTHGYLGLVLTSVVIAVVLAALALALAAVPDRLLPRLRSGRAEPGLTRA
jgi:hypothetical protein